MTLRLRTRGNFEVAPSFDFRTRFVDCSNTNWVNGQFYSALLVGKTETMRDVVTPGFHKKQVKGEVFFNPMSYEKRTSGYLPGIGHYIQLIAETCAATHTHYEVEYLNGAWLSYWLSSVYPTPVPVPCSGVILESDIASLVTEVSTRCLAARGKADNDLFESVAEYKQTLSMFLHPTQSLFRFISKNGERIRRLSPENAWLAWRYGLKPFINDVQGIIDGLKKKVGLKRKTTRAKGEIQRSEIASLSSYRYPVTATFNKQTVDQVTVRAMSLDEYSAGVASNIGFTAKGLITLPWELIPYSFVADWFVNVGDFIGALAPAPGYKQLGSCVTVSRVINNVYVPTSVSVTSPYQHPANRQMSGNCFSSLETKTRSLIGAPGLVIKSDFRLDDSIRVADALSLLKQKLDRLIRH